MQHSSIYQYTSPRQFVLDRLNQLQAADPSTSVRKLARKMGMKSHALLVMLLQGKRPLRVRHAAALARGLRLTSEERLYLQALIQFDSATDPEEKHLCTLWLSDLNPGEDFRVNEVDAFLAIAHWVHMAILAMTDLRDGLHTADAIHERLKNRVTIHEVRAALERLLSLGLIERKSDGRLASTFHKVTTPNDVANAGARKYHQDVSDLAKQAIESAPLATREFQSFAIAVSRDQLPVAKEMIRKFRSRFSKAMQSELGDEVYQMNIQFFQLTESPGRMAAREDEGVDAEFNPKPKMKGPTYVSQ